MSKKTSFLRIFQKIALFACAFCAFFISPVFATLPAGYTELEYIESTGTQYIDTGIKDTYKVEFSSINFTSFNTNYNLLYGSQSTSPVVRRQVLVGASTYKPSANCGTNGNASVPTSDTVLSTNQNYRITAIFDTISKISVDGTETVGDAGDNASTNLNDYLFCYNYGGSANFKVSVKCGEIKIWQNANTLARNFIPAKRNSDSVIGMYDTVSGRFFTNAGKGSFVAGPEKSISEIKIATTKMVDEEFAAAEAKLATTVQTIESVVSRTIAQTGQIQILQDTKQTRPDESCPANMKCLLVQDEDGTPHWYPIIEP